MAYAVVRTDNLAGTVVPSKLVSAKYFVSDAATASENGNIAVLDSLMDGEREIYKAVKPAATSKIGTVILVATPEVMADERKRNLDDFTNEAGKAIRGYILDHGDVFSVTAEAFTGTPAVNSIVEAQADTKLKVVSTLTSGSTQIGKIIAKETVGSKEFFVIRVD